jgi:hypothetical protein
MSKQIGFTEAKNSFFVSLLSALAGVGLIGASVHFGAQNDFLANLFQNGGTLFGYLLGAGIVGGFVLGVYLVARHVAREGVAEHFYEQTPY